MPPEYVNSLSDELLLQRHANPAIYTAMCWSQTALCGLGGWGLLWLLETHLPFQVFEWLRDSLISLVVLGTCFSALNTYLATAGPLGHRQGIQYVTWLILLSPIVLAGAILIPAQANTELKKEGKIVPESLWNTFDEKRPFRFTIWRLGQVVVLVALAVFAWSSMKENLRMRGRLNEFNRIAEQSSVILARPEGKIVIRRVSKLTPDLFDFRIALPPNRRYELVISSTVRGEVCREPLVVFSKNKEIPPQKRILFSQTFGRSEWQLRIGDEDADFSRTVDVAIPEWKSIPQNMDWNTEDQWLAEDSVVHLLSGEQIDIHLETAKEKADEIRRPFP